MVEQEGGTHQPDRDDAEVDSREMKHPAQVARLALLMQVLRYASGEGNLQSVDTAPVKAAIRLNGYFEDSYCRIRSFSWRICRVMNYFLEGVKSLCMGESQDRAGRKSERQCVCRQD